MRLLTPLLVSLIVPFLLLPVTGSPFPLSHCWTDARIRVQYLSTIFGIAKHGGEYEGSPPSGSDAERSGRGRPR